MKVELGRIIPDIVEAMLPRWSGWKVGLLMQIRHTVDMFSSALDSDDGGDESLAKQFRSISFLFVREANYTKVFARVQNKFDMHLNQKLPWIMEGDHDSCWREDPNRVLRGAEQKVRDFFGDEVSDKDLYVYTSFEVLSRGIHYVEIKEMESPKTDNKHGVAWQIELGKNYSVDHLPYLLRIPDEEQKRIRNEFTDEEVKEKLGKYARVKFRSIEPAGTGPACSEILDEERHEVNP